MNNLAKLWSCEESKTVNVLNGSSSLLVSYSKSIFTSLYPETRLDISASLLYLTLLKTSTIWLWFSASVWFENCSSVKFKISLFVPSPEVLKLVLFVSILSLSCAWAIISNCWFDDEVFISIVIVLILLSGSKIISVLSYAVLRRESNWSSFKSFGSINVGSIFKLPFSVTTETRSKFNTLSWGKSSVGTRLTSKEATILPSLTFNVSGSSKALISIILLLSIGFSRSTFKEVGLSLTVV